MVHVLGTLLCALFVATEASAPARRLKSPIAERESSQPISDKAEVVAIKSYPEPAWSLTRAAEEVATPAKLEVNDSPLPSVSSLLSSTATVKSLSSQATVLSSQVVEAEVASEAKLARQKTLFEGKLKEQESKIQNATAINKKIPADISILEKANKVLDKHIKALTSTNHVMQMELTFLKKKLGGAGEFAGNTMATSFLEVSQSHPNTMVLADNFASAMGDLAGGADSDPAKQANVDPDALIDDLSTKVSHLKDQEKTTEDNLKQMFVQKYSEGAKKLSALMLQQKIFVDQRRVLERQHIALKKSEKQLMQEHTQLQRGLHSLSNYLKELSNLAAAPSSQVPRMLRALPKKIA